MAANAADIDLSDDKNINGGGDSSDDDAKNSTNQRDNYEEELETSRLENLLFDDSGDKITENHTGADGALAQLIKMHQEKRKSMHMEK